MSASITQRTTPLPEREGRRRAPRRRFGARATSPTAAPRLRCRRRDLAYARLLVGAELLASDFYTQAIAAANTGPTRHEVPEARLRQRAGALPVGRRDHQRRRPDACRVRGHRLQLSGRDVRRARNRSSSSRSSSRARSSAPTSARSAGSRPNALKAGLARIAACEAQHSSYFTTALGGKAFSLSFPAALTIDQASNALDAYTA